jgi:hypothetical protein
MNEDLTETVIAGAVKIIGAGIKRNHLAVGRYGRSMAMLIATAPGGIHRNTTRDPGCEIMNKYLAKTTLAVVSGEIRRQRFECNEPSVGRKRRSMAILVPLFAARAQGNASYCPRDTVAEKDMTEAIPAPVAIKIVGQGNERDKLSVLRNCRRVGDPITLILLRSAGD